MPCGRDTAAGTSAIGCGPVPRDCRMPTRSTFHHGAVRRGAGRKTASERASCARTVSGAWAREGLIRSPCDVPCAPGERRPPARGMPAGPAFRCAPRVRPACGESRRTVGRSSARRFGPAKHAGGSARPRGGYRRQCRCVEASPARPGEERRAFARARAVELASAHSPRRSPGLAKHARRSAHPRGRRRRHADASRHRPPGPAKHAGRSRVREPMARKPHALTPSGGGWCGGV
jgi:hypothetical protein